VPIDFSRIDQMVSQLRYVKSGDIVLSSDHNLQNDAIKELADLLKSHPRPPAIVVAAFDSPEELKRRADYVCDGFRDQEEINEALAKSSTVVLCDGTYQIDDAIVVPDNSCIIGLANATIRTSRNESFNFVRVIGKSNVKICGIRFHLPFKPSERVYIYAIYIENSTNVIVEGCEFTGFFETGVFVIGKGGWCRDVRVVRNRFDGTNGDIYFENCINIIASENVSYNCDYYSIFLWTSSGVISKNLFRDCGAGIGVYSYVDEWFEGQLVVVSDNVIASSLSIAIDVYCFPAIVISNNCASVKPGGRTLSVICVYDVELSVISGNCVDGGGSASHGIYVDYWDVTTAHCYVMQNVVRNVSENGVFGWLRNINVTGNVIYRCGRYGIALITWDGVISSNVVHTTSQEENNRWSSIYVEYSENLVIEGNRCYVGDEANKPKYGIYIGDACQYVVVHGNNLYQSGVTGDLYVTSGTNTRARDNVGNNGEWLSET